MTDPGPSSGCGHEQIAQPDWVSHGDQPYVVSLTCMLCGAETMVDLGDVITNEWVVPPDYDEREAR